MKETTILQIQCLTRNKTNCRLYDGGPSGGTHTSTQGIELESTNDVIRYVFKFVFLEMMHVLHVVVDIHTCILGVLP